MCKVFGKTVIVAYKFGLPDCERAERRICGEKRVRAWVLVVARQAGMLSYRVDVEIGLGI
jgi:hypothetical protein